MSQPETRSYIAKSQELAWEASADDRARFEARGWWAAGQVWSEGLPGPNRIIALGAFMAALFPPKGSLTITYVPRVPEPAEPAS